tara:strand:+ start:603 stop:1574 length:972 start_codon:yes stop_codon:yes gene_type:complete
MSIIEINNGDCLELMKDLPDKSIDLFICDLPYAETNCKWDVAIDMEKFWSEFRRLRASPRVACIHFCSTKFGYTLIKSWEKGYKMDMVWKKRNKTGGLQSRHRPMRNHEMIYFFYDQAPKYNRDTYHKRITPIPKFQKDSENVYGNNKKKNTQGTNSFDPPNPASVVEEEDPDVYGETKEQRKKRREKGDSSFTPPNPASVLEEKDEFGWDKSVVKEKGTKFKGGNFEPVNPVSVLEEVDEDEPVTMFESTKVFIGKRHHQTEKPQDILEFFIKYWTDEGETILDPTMGSGSTGVACKKLGRNFIGYEMDEKIFNVAKARIEK